MKSKTLLPLVLVFALAALLFQTGCASVEVAVSPMAELIAPNAHALAGDSLSQGTPETLTSANAERASVRATSYAQIFGYRLTRVRLNAALFALACIAVMAVAVTTRPPPSQPKAA